MEDALEGVGEVGIVGKAATPCDLVDSVFGPCVLTTPSASLAHRPYHLRTDAHLVGFRRFLKDFSLIGERHVVEVTLWREYMVFALISERAAVAELTAPGRGQLAEKALQDYELERQK